MRERFHLIFQKIEMTLHDACNQWSLTGLIDNLDHAAADGDDIKDDDAGDHMVMIAMRTIIIMKILMILGINMMMMMMMVMMMISPVQLRHESTHRNQWD